MKVCAWINSGPFQDDIRRFRIKAELKELVK